MESTKLGLDADQLAVDLVSNNMHDFFHLDVDHASSLSVWEGNPSDYGAKPAVVSNRGKVERCYAAFE